jgi:hypothetical protein
VPDKDRQAVPTPRSSAHRYRVDVALERGEKVFAVVAPSGARLYTYADPRTAEAEATVLNDGAVTPSVRRS